MQCPLISPTSSGGWWSWCSETLLWCLITRCRPAICLCGDRTRHKSKANGDQIIVPLRAEMAGKSIEGANWWIKQEI